MKTKKLQKEAQAKKDAKRVVVNSLGMTIGVINGENQKNEKKNSTNRQALEDQGKRVFSDSLNNLLSTGMMITRDTSLISVSNYVLFKSQEEKKEMEDRRLCYEEASNPSTRDEIEEVRRYNKKILKTMCLEEEYNNNNNKIVYMSTIMYEPEDSRIVGGCKKLSDKSKIG